MKNYKSLLLLTPLFFLYACGGGGGGGGSPAPSEPSPTSSLSSSSSSVLIDTVVTLTWSSTNATSCTATGTWTGTKATSGTEDVTISTPGNNQFTITCSGAGGSQAASVTVEGYRNTEGVSVDGYIRQADIFIDTNDSYTADSGEDTTTSDNDGKFTIKYSDGNLISLGGTDLDSGNALDNLLIVHKLTGHSNFKAVTPVTSVAAFMADPTLVNAALGIDTSLDIATVDPVAGKGDGGINDYLYEKGNQLTVLAYALQNITNNLNTTTDTTQDYFKAIAEELDTEYAATTLKVDIENQAFLTKVLENVISAKTLTMSDENKANTLSALASILPILEVKSTNALTTAVIDFATSTLQTDIQAIANGTASADTVTSYQADILNYIATDQNVDADELAPNISAISESVTTNEDTDIEIDVLANDSYLTSAPISITAENGLYGTTTISNNLVTFSPNKDFNGTDAFDYTIVQGDKISSASVTLNISPVNDAPSFDNLLSTYNKDENQKSITTVVGIDIDEDALTISLSGADEASFNLSSTNDLTFVEAPDYEIKSSYLISLSLSDGIETITKDITINISDIQEVFILDDTFENDEDIVSLIDVMSNDSYIGTSFVITVEAGINGTTSINTSDGESKINFAPNLNWFGSEELSYTITAGSESRSGKVTLVYLPVNDPPVFNSISRSIEVTVEPNSNGTGDVYVIDEIQKNSLTLEPGSTYTFNHPSAHPLRFSTTSDGTHESGTAYETDVDTSNDGITIIKVTEDTPTLYYYCSIHSDMGSNASISSSSIASFIVLENNTSDIVTIGATDVDNEILTYSLSGDDKDLFTISTSGILKFQSSPDYEDPQDLDKNSVYKLSLSVSDEELSIFKDISIPIQDVNLPATQIGQTLQGQLNQNSGSCYICLGGIYDIDEDGDTFVIKMSGSRQRAGWANVYELKNNSWSEMSTNKLSGATSPGAFGAWGMEISSDGKTLVGSGKSTNISYVFPFEYYDAGNGAGLEWRRRGDYVDYGYIYSTAGGISDVALSGDGNVVGYALSGSSPIIHAKENTIDFTFNSGKRYSSFNTGGSETTGIAINQDGTYVVTSQIDYEVRVFKWDGTDYLQIGNSINRCSGDTYTENMFGYSYGQIAISDNGKTIAVSSNYADDPNTTETRTGAICVFEYINSSWTQKGSTIWGEKDDYELGIQIDLSGDAKRLTVGSFETAGVEWNDPDRFLGKVKVYEWSNLDTNWKQTGFDINGELAGDQVGRMSMSSDGNSLVINYGMNGGRIKVYKLPIN